MVDPNRITLTLQIELDGRIDGVNDGDGRNDGVNNGIYPDLKKKGYIVREGSTKTGKWIPQK